MVNDPMPRQLTVGALRTLLENVPDGAVVGLRVPAGGIGDPQLQLFCNLSASYGGGLVFIFEPVSKASSP
jgi:hypothetical protein